MTYIDISKWSKKKLGGWKKTLLCMCFEYYNSRLGLYNQRALIKDYVSANIVIILCKSKK